MGVLALVATLFAAVPSRWRPKFVPRVTIECASGGDATIDARGDAIAIVGDCATVTITGERNAMTIASAHRLVVPGNGNRVLSSATADEIDVRGDDNYVATPPSAHGPRVRNSGRDNTIAVGRNLTIQLQ